MLQLNFLPSSFQELLAKKERQSTEGEKVNGEIQEKEENIANTEPATCPEKGTFHIYLCLGWLIFKQIMNFVCEWFCDGSLIKFSIKIIVFYKCYSHIN